ncbi:hypothetical protein [Shewanella acanthi]|uniref:hypothetical protein n=1 Tax=Shewanella acanthi TaxID=2864212 RepID=UPI001C65AB88|nr:hypothetical protein [Shewanella acanthi]QYJ78599.1 hypothetical protein K0H61_16170 [Shewanella acanthi]
MKRCLAIRPVLLMLGILSLSGCFKTPEWTLFYYPDVSALPLTPLQTKDINGYFDTLEQCQSKAHGLQRLSSSGVSGFGLGVYQCGQQCQFDDQSVLQCKALSQ